MKFGLLTWSLRSLRDGAPWEDSLKKTAELGYSATELITCVPEDLDNYWKVKVKDIGKLCKDMGLRISQFAMFQPVSGNFSSSDKAKRAQTLENVKKSADIANQLGTPLLNFVAPWPEGIEAPIPYIPRYYYVDEIGGEPKLRMKLPKGFDWEEIWSTYVEVIGQCLEVCKEHDLVLSVENHLHTITPYTDSFLRLWDNFKDPALGCNLDIGWIFLGREYVPISILKLGKRLVNIHLRDCDGFAKHFVCPGMGAIDWETVREALDQVGYDGDVNLELSEFADREVVARTTVDLVKKYFQD
jgi:sugar phosphate isomerase/epimerase